MDPLSLVAGDLSGSLTGPSSSASSDGTQASPFNPVFTSFGSNNKASGSTLAVIGLAVVALLILKKRRR